MTEQYVDIAIFSILGVMSFCVVMLAIERFIYFKKVDIHDFSQVQALQVSLTKNLTAIATIGSNAPYVGLLGTVIGILVTFDTIGSSNHVQINEIMVGLAMALKATAAGLVVAIPAMMIYNGLSRSVETITAQWSMVFESQESRVNHKVTASA